jgi:ATP-dependent Clp protease ATP-binding subunit ClpA
LSLDELKQIVDIQVRDLARRLAFSGISLELTDAAKEHLAETGYDRTYGARPLRRVIQRDLETPLSKRLLHGDMAAGQTVVADYSAEDGITFAVQAPVEVESVVV